MRALNRDLPLTIANRAYSQNTSIDEGIKVLQPGLVVIENGLSIGEQSSLSMWALEHGKDPENGFWKTDEEGREVLNQTVNRGRFYDVCPDFLSVLCQRYLNAASKIDKTIQPIKPTHVICLYYQTHPKPNSSYIPWHQDKDPNDGDADKPVVSFSIGDSCDFLICNEKPVISQTQIFSNPINLAHRVKLASGTVLLFGGPSRKIHHSVYEMNSDAPPFLPFTGARLNFTFRFTPELKGKEKEYSSKTFKSVYNKKV